MDTVEKMSLKGISAPDDTEIVIGGNVVMIPKGDPMDNAEFIDAFRDYLRAHLGLGGPRFDRINALARIGAEAEIRA